MADLVVAVLSPSQGAWVTWCASNGYTIDRDTRVATRAQWTALRVLESADLEGTVIDQIDYAPGWWHGLEQATAVIIDVEARAHLRRHGGYQV